MSTPDEAIAILAVFGNAGLHEDVWWRTDGEYAPITLFAHCEDLYEWVTVMTIDNLPRFAQAIRDCTEVDHVVGPCYAVLLFCCREHGMRPNQYPEEPEFWPLFDACGPNGQTPNAEEETPWASA